MTVSPVGPKGLDRHHGAADEVALRGKARVACLFLVDLDTVAVFELFVEVAALLSAKDFREELDSAGPVEGVQKDKVGHGFRVEVEEPFAHLVGLEEEGAVGGAAAEEPEHGPVQRMPAALERAAEPVQGRVGSDAELDVLELRSIEEGDFEEARRGFDDQLALAAGEDFAGDLKAAGTGFEGDLGSVMDGLGEAAEGQVPFDRVDLGHAGEEKQAGVGEETVAGADHDSGASGCRGQILQEDDQTLAAGVGVQPVQFLAKAGLEGFDGDWCIVGSFGALEGAVQFLE